jgi:hypothetical protein
MQEGARDTLARLLDTYPADLVSALAREVPSADGRPLAEGLLDEARVGSALDAAGQMEREFLAFIACHGGEVTPAAADWWLRHREVGDPSAIVERLAARGLLFYLPARGRRPAPALELFQEPRGVRFAGKLWVPEPVAAQATQRCPEALLSAAEEPLQVTRGDPWEVIRWLFVLTRHLTEQKPRLLSASGKIARSDVPRLAEALGDLPAQGCARDELLGWLESLAIRAGVAEEGDRRLVPSPNAAALFTMAPLSQRRLLLEAATAQTGWSELDAAPAIVTEVPSAIAPGHSDIPPRGNRVRARRHILRVLVQATAPGEWHSLAELAERVMEAAPDFLIRRRQATGHRPQPAEPPGSGALDAEAEGPTYRGIRRAGGDGPQALCMVRDWMLVEGAFTARFLTGPLHWLGLVDLGTRDGDDLFRLSQLGARVLGLTAETGEEDATPPGRFFVQPNFEIMADGGGENIGAICRLSRVANLTSYDRAALFQVTRESVVRGLDSGLAREEVLRILSDDGRVSVPQNVAYSVGEWVTAYDRYELRTEAYLLETDDPAELAALEEELPGCLERIARTVARVLPGMTEMVERALAGRAEVLAIDHGEGLSQVFELDEQMTATPLEPKWYWYPEHLLSQISKRMGGHPTRFRLTRESVRAALAQGLEPEEIERFIEVCSGGDLSPQQRLLLRGWLGRYEPAQLGSATLLALPSEAVRDLLPLSEFREQIVGRLSPTVFVVRPTGRAKVKRLLEKAGLTIDDELPATPLGGGLAPGLSPSRERGDGGEGSVWGRRRWRDGDPEPERLAFVEEAIERRLRLEIEYQSVVKGDAPRRWVISPQSIERSRWGQVRLHAYCHERQTQRAFDVSRMSEVVLLDVPATESP